MEGQPEKQSAWEQREKERQDTELLVAAAGELATPQLFEQANEVFMNDTPFGD